MIARRPEAVDLQTNLRPMEQRNLQLVGERTARAVQGANRRTTVDLTNKTKILMAAAFITLSPAAAVAQNAVSDDTTVTNSYDPATDTERTTTVTREEDNDFPWGLLGLLGLAGLLGRKRKEADVHVDARHNTRP
jgi:LPXTG-motif cell wall-anchored protein